MRRLLILFFLFTQFVHAQPTGKPFTFAGTVANAPDGYVYLSYVDSGRHYIQDSSRLMNGRFSFTGYISSPAMASFQGTGANGWTDHPRYTNVFLEPGKMQAVFPKKAFKHGSITGSKSQKEYTIYKKQLTQLDTKWKKALEALEALRNNLEVEKNRKIVDAQVPLRNAAVTQLSRRYVWQHPQSYVSAMLMLGQMYQLSFDSLKIYYSHMAPSVQTGVEGSAVGEFIHKEESISIGKPAPDFMQPDSSGSPVWLHDFKGQYVLLDIWASWCVPCREEHPYLRQAYAKYKHKGFTILSLSMDEERFKSAWLEAIKKDSLTWPQLCDFKAWTNTVVSDYNVLGKGIPASFLINPQGIIVAMNLRGKALEEKLEESLPNPSKGGAIEP